MAYKQKKWEAFSCPSGAFKSKKLEQAEKEMKKQKEAYSKSDTSNPYENMENVYEDMTVDTRERDIKKQDSDQKQAQVLKDMKMASGTSGAASLAQFLSQQNQMEAQRSSASIGGQERENQLKKREFAGKIQDKKREGEKFSREAESDKQKTLLSMAQQEVGAQREMASRADKAKFDAIQSGVQNVSNTLSS